VVKELVPKLSTAQCSIMMPLGDAKGDVKYWVELGASIMMDKPIIAMVESESQVPAKLRMVADEIVICPGGDFEAAKDQLAAAMKRILERG
jgi:hypothetical protein